MELIEQDSENLADLIWWLWGYLAGLNSKEEYHIDNSHIKTLQRCREYIFDKQAQEETL